MPQARKMWKFKQLLDEVFVISGIIKGEVRTLTETMVIPDIIKTESNNFDNNCFIVHCLKENNDKCDVEWKHTSLSARCHSPPLNFDIRNHALRAQPTNCSIICQQISE